METIKTYLENMFANLPKTKEIQKVKSDLLNNMEDKYNELKHNGKSENEAIGIVISEFGNIDELMNELGIEQGNLEEGFPTLSEEEVNHYLEDYKKSGKIIGLGVVLCILGPAILIFLTQLVEDGFITGISEGFGDILGLIPLLVLITIGVSLFIYAGMKLEKYKYIKEGVELPTHVSAAIQQKNDFFHSTYTLSVIIGVALCILSPMILFITSAISESASNYGVILLLLIIAVAIYIFIYYGMIKDSYKTLLKIGEYARASKERREEERVIRIAAIIVWPLVACIYLISSFVFNHWHVSWIIFPITGILFGMFSATYRTLKEKR